MLVDLYNAVSEVTVVALQQGMDLEVSALELLALGWGHCRAEIVYVLEGELRKI